MKQAFPEVVNCVWLLIAGICIQQSASTPVQTVNARVRLVGGHNDCSGRVEVFQFRQWGSVCANDWKRKNAEVVCRELGCGQALDVPGGTRFGRGNKTPVLVDKVKCSGQEPSLTYCQSVPSRDQKCEDSEYASVICAETPTTTQATGATKDQLNARVRLVGGHKNCSGRVEVFQFRQWGSVCANDWKRKNAEVVCRELGCGQALDVPGGTRFGRGNKTPVLVDKVKCSGQEPSLTYCQSVPSRDQKCEDSEYASVICAETPTTTQATGATKDQRNTFTTQSMVFTKTQGISINVPSSDPIVIQATAANAQPTDPDNEQSTSINVPSSDPIVIQATSANVTTAANAQPTDP